MSLQSLIEQLQLDFPQFGETYLKVLINNAYLQFCHKTEILHNKLVVGNDDDTWQFDDTNAYSPLAEINKVKSIVFIKNGAELEGLEYVIRGSFIDLTLPSGYSETNFTSLFDTMPLEIVVKPVKLDKLEDETELSDDFAQAIIYAVKEALYSRVKDYPGASYYRSKYKELVIEGIKEGNEGKDGSPLTPVMRFE